MSLATLTNTGRAAIASAIASRPLHLAWGTGDPAWDADDASLPSLVNATALTAEVGRRLATAVGYVEPDDEGDIVIPVATGSGNATNKRYKQVAGPTPYLYIRVNFNFEDASSAIIREVGVFKILTEEQLLQYYRYEALPAAYARGREAKKIVSKQLQLTYMELKYVNNAFFVIEQETQAAKKFWRGNPAEARDRIRSVYEREIAQLEAKSGIRIDKQMRAVRVVELTDYAPLMPAGK